MGARTPGLRARRRVGRACLVTGASGFIGRHLLPVLSQAGEEVVALGRNPVPGYRTIVADLAGPAIHLPNVAFGDVYHLAGLAHANDHDQATRELYARINVHGFRHLLDALDRGPVLPRAVVALSTVAVYGLEQGELLEETTARRATGPYGASKREAEDMLWEWAARRGVRTAVVRVPLVAGMGVPGNLGKMLAAMGAGWYLGIGDGQARRSIVLASDLVRALPRIATTGGVFHLTDGQHPTLAELEETLAQGLGRRAPAHLPLWLARQGARLGDCLERALGRRLPFSSRVLEKMTCSLTFSDVRARREVGWSPRPVIAHVRELLERQATLHEAAEPSQNWSSAVADVPVDQTGGLRP